MIFHMEETEPHFYQQKHNETETRILKAAKALLLKNGFRQVTMGDIAGDCGLSRQRVYSYFSGMDEIIYEIQSRDMEAAISYLNRVLSFRNGSAGESLRRIVEAMFSYEEKFSEDFIFTGEFDMVYRQRVIPDALRIRYQKIYAESTFFSDFIRLLQDGQQSGEFRADFSAEDAARYWINTIQLLCVRIAIFRVNGENHSTAELAKLKECFSEALFRYLQ